MSYIWQFNKEENKLSLFSNREKREEFVDSLLSEDIDFTNAYIGRDAKTGDTCLKGNIYSVRIYNRELTQSEIQENYKIDKIRFLI